MTRQQSQGMTLIETLIALSLMSVLFSVSGYLFLVTLRAWHVGLARGGIREDTSYAIEKVLRTTREMESGSLSDYAGISHTVEFNDLQGDTYVLYLHNVADTSLDGSYGEDTYQLMQANTSSGDDPSSGDGILLLRDVVSPNAVFPASALTLDANNTMLTLDLVLLRDDEKVRTRTKVRPRNL